MRADARLALLVGAAALACGPDAPPAPFAEIVDLEPVREAFEAGVGRPRVLMLAAPT